MPLKVDHLVGRKFIHGRADCYGLVRDFYADNFGLVLPNYARPDEWWAHGMDLYRELFHENGFRPVLDHPSTWRSTDAVLMAIRSKTINHAAVFVEDGKILHHFYNHLSKVEPYAGLWRNTTLMVLRHKDIHPEDIPRDQVDLWELIPDAVRQKLSARFPGTGE